MAPPTLPATKRRLPSIRESPPTSPSFAKRSSGFFSFRRPSLPSASPPPTRATSASKKSSTDSSNIVAVPQTPDSPTFGPPLPLPTQIDTAEEIEDLQERAEVPRPPRSSGTFGFTGAGDEELMFEELGISREQSGGASTDSLGEGETMVAQVEGKRTEGIASPPPVVVLVDEIEGSQEVLDSPFELEDSTYGQLHLPSDSMDSLPEQRRGGTFGSSPPAVESARPHPAPALIPLLSTPPPPTSFFPRSLHHQSSSLTIFLTPQSSPSASLANIDPLATSLQVDALAPPLLPLSVEASPPEVTPMKGAEEAILELPLMAERGLTEASDSELGKSGSMGGRRDESRDGGEGRLSSTPSPVQSTFLPPLLLRPTLSPSPAIPISVQASASLTSLQEHRTRLTSLATTLQAESRRLSESRSRLEEVNASLSAELDLIVLEIEKERRASSTRDRRSSAGASVRMPMIDFLREEATQTDDEGGRVRVGLRGGGSGLKDELVIGGMSEGSGKDTEKSEKEQKKKKRRSWGARLFGGGESKSRK